MEFLLDPGIWVGLITLIILEIVLGIDNLVFIAILSEKFCNFVPLILDNSSNRVKYF